MPFTYQFFDKNTQLNDNVFGVSKTNRVKQIHSAKVIEIIEPQRTWIEADAIITRTSNLPIGVITADCAPVLFYSDEGVIGAIHAGWQGAVSGVLENTIEAMQCPSSSIQAFIGPCISQSSYEVSIGFEKPFLDHNAEAEKFFIGGKADKLHFDLAGYCAFQLRNAGVQKIHIDGRDTLTDPQFHSHRGGATSSERNLSAIMIKG